MSAAPTRSALYEGRVWHRRFKPRTHKLAYKLFMVLVDLDELPALDRSLKLFGHNRMALCDVRETDHFDGSKTPLKTQVETLLADAGYETGGRVRLLCMPRTLGAVFNPISVFFCEARDGRLQAILYEVNNTFGQRHSYLMRGGQGEVRHGVAKRFYVSPFNGMNLHYAFRVLPPGDVGDEQPLALRIDVTDADGPLMIAGFVGERAPLTDKTILAALLRHPLLIAKVVGGIHWEALKIWLKGVKLTPRPPAPTSPVTVGERMG